MPQKYNPDTGQWEDDGTIPAPPTGTDTPTKGDLPPTAPLDMHPATADPSLLGPNFSGPLPASFGGPATSADQTPVPGVNPQVVYTDASGQGYDPAQLYANRNALLQDPTNARIRDILQTYGYGSAPAAAAAPAAGGGGGGGGGATAAGRSSSTFNDAVRQILLQQLGEATKPVDPNAPEILATESASRDAGQRAADQERTALAERLYAQGGGAGLNTNALTQQIQQSGEKQAAAQSALKAQLLTHEYDAKRQQLQSLLAMAVQSGDAESARSIQMAIANLNAAVQREGLGVNLAEFGATLDQNATLAGLRG